MGLILSIPVIRYASPASTAQPTKKKKRKGKKREKRAWKSILSMLFNLLGKNGTGATLQANGSNEEKLTLITGRMESEQKEVAIFLAENHNHIVCEHSRAKFMSVVSFLAGMDMFKSVDVPGKEAQIKVTKEIVRRLLIGILVRVRHLHSEGKTLNGCFTTENIYVPIFNKDQDGFVAPYMEVKLDLLHPDSFQPYTDDGGNKDLMKVGSILENIFSSETWLPSDLQQLLELLHTDPISNKILIYAHVSLMGPRDQVSYFQWLYKRLTYLKKKAPDKYDSITKKIKIDPDGWKSRAGANKFLAKLNPYGKYSINGRGLSRFYRNSVEHLFKMFKYAKQNLASSEEEELQELEDYHIIYILTEAFPDVLVDLQKAFYEEGELQTFIVEDST